MARILPTIASGIVLAASAAFAPANAASTYSQGFETDTAGWNDGGSYGTITRVPSGTGGIASSEGSYHAVVEQSDAGPYTFFDGARDVFTGAITTSLDIYLDTSWADGAGFDYSVAANGTDGNHQRDYIFHVTMDSSTQQLLVGVSNNTNFDPVENLEDGNHVVIASSGWYTFEHVLRDDGGQLAVDLNLYGPDSSTLLFTQTLTDALDTIPGEVGGNRYGWFTNIDIAGGIAIDDAQLSVAPLPPAIILFLSGMAGLGWFGRRGRAGKEPSLAAT